MSGHAYVELVLRRARLAYQRYGVLPLDVETALVEAGLSIEDVINSIEETDHE